MYVTVYEAQKRRRKKVNVKEGERKGIFCVACVNVRSGECADESV